MPVFIIKTNFLTHRGIDVGRIFGGGAKFPRKKIGPPQTDFAPPQKKSCGISFKSISQALFKYLAGRGVYSIVCIVSPPRPNFLPQKFDKQKKKVLNPIGSVNRGKEKHRKMINLQIREGKGKKYFFPQH